MPEVGSVIHRDPQIQGGVPVFRGTRVPLRNLIDYLEGGDDLEAFLDDFPSVTREQAVAALEEAAQALEATCEFSWTSPCRASRRPDWSAATQSA